MSFRCSICKEPQPVGVRPVHHVAVYQRREYQGTYSISLGTEVRSEQKLCEPCAEAVPAPSYLELPVVEEPQTLPSGPLTQRLVTKAKPALPKGQIRNYEKSKR